MIILTNLGDNVKSYLELVEKGNMPLPRECPDCGHPLSSMHGTTGARCRRPRAAGYLSNSAMQALPQDACGTACRIAGTIAAALARGVRRLAPTSDVDGIFRRETDPLGLLWAATRALWAACKEADPGFPLAPERLPELGNAYLMTERTGLWV